MITLASGNTHDPEECLRMATPLNGMSDVIHCRYRWTVDEFITANEQYRRHSRAVRKLLVGLWVAAIVLLAAGVIRLVNFGFNKTSVVLMVFGVVIVMSRLFSGRVLARTFANHPDRDADVQVQVYPDRLVLETKTARTEIAWSRITNMVRTEQGFVLYFQPGAFHWLPLHGFAQAADIERFESLVANQVNGS